MPFADCPLRRVARSGQDAYQETRGSRIAAGFRHHVAQSKALDLRGEILEHGKCREQRECDGNQWHQRQQSGKSQAGRHLRAMILLEAHRDEMQQLP